MRLLLAAVLAAAVASAGDKPSPRQKAKELLDAAAEMIAATRPDVQPAALLHLADNYQAIDRKKSVEYFQQAFTAAGQPPAGSSALARNMMADIVVMLAAVDGDKAIELLKQIPARAEGYDNRSYAASRTIDVLIEKKRLADAVALADYMGGAGAYPVVGVSHIMSKLPEGDPQRLALFSAMMTAYTVKPDRSFHEILMRRHKELPPGMAQAALKNILNAILDKKEGDYQPETLASAKGTVTFTSRQDAELFDVMPLVREIDPKRYDELTAAHAELRSALDLFPGGGPSVYDDKGVTIYTVRSSNPSDPAEKRQIDAANERMKMQALVNSRVQAALQEAAKDPDKALDMVAGIPSQARQAEVLGRIAESVAEGDPQKARRVLSKCTSLLEEVKRPADRVLPWDLVASAAARAKDDALVQTAIDRLLSDAAELYKQDSNPDRPNRMWREYWPSTQAYRRAIVRATKLMGVDAETLLPKITDPDLNVLARLTMAQALLERPFDDFRTY